MCHFNQILCQGQNLYLENVTWCCQMKEKCGENYQRCQSIFTFALSRYLLIITSAFLISVFIVRCFFLCLNCRTNSTNDHYQSVEMINEEESSPPSYEQVMNENNHYRLENF